MAINVMSKTTQNIYEMYTKGKIKVNRRYQRKLVWSVDEKASFIDSLIKGYPIPLIIALKINKDEYEILDGLQRLNAITSFIEQEFSIQGKYFDPNSITLTKNIGLNNYGYSNLVSDEKISSFLNYPVPFGISESDSQEFIDETFRRINTKGRQLSKQDVRQAGTIGDIPDIINTIAMYVRKDSSQSQLLTLEQIKNISIGETKSGYGIDINNIPWVVNGIINKSDIRKSRDEELIAYLLSYIVDEKAQTTAKYLDAMYDNNSDTSTRMNNEVSKAGKDYYISSFNYVFDEIFMKIFGNNREKFVDTVYGRSKFLKSSTVFQMIFLAVYELLINENKKIVNYKQLHTSLKGLAKNFEAVINSENKWKHQDRVKCVKSMKGLINEHFVPNKNKMFSPGSWIKNLENIINESRCEQNFFDFKIGFLDLSPNDKNKYNFNDKAMDKVLKTLTAMANTVQEECMVIIGVADEEKDAKHRSDILKSAYPTEYEGKFITGIQDEAKYLYPENENYIEEYILHIKNRIKNNDKLPTDFREKLCQNIINFTYKEKEILVLKSQRGEQPIFFDGKIYVRHSSNISELKTGTAEFIEKIQEFGKA